MNKIREIEEEIKNEDRIYIYAMLEDALLDSEGKIHLILDKKQEWLVEDLVRLVRKYFVGEDIICMLNILIPHIDERRIETLLDLK